MSCKYFLNMCCNVRTNIVMALLLLCFLTCCVNAAVLTGSEEVVSPLRIAQCRARCLLKFSEGPAKRKDCLQGPDCFMCWENCELLQANFAIWGSICDTEICYPGCKEACRFHKESSQAKQVEPVIKARGEELLKIEDNVAKWPRPGAASPATALVYIVMRRNADSSWTQMAQTVETSIALPRGTSTANLRVLVADTDGIVTMYSPADRLPVSAVSRIMAGVRNDKVSLNTPKPGAWSLREVSLIHQKVLVVAEVSWEPRALHAVYLVTWEVDGGGLRGNLFTDSTCVTLSLWPDTIYHIQVEVVSKMDKSLPLVLDTRKALQVSFDTSENPLDKEVVIPELPQFSLDDTLKSKSTEMSVKITKSINEGLKFNPRKMFSRKETSASLEEQFETPKSNLQSPPRISSTLSSVLVDTVSSQPSTELVLGSVTAVLLFLLICVLLALRASRGNPKQVKAAKQPHRTCSPLQGFSEVHV